VGGEERNRDTKEMEEKKVTIVIFARATIKKNDGREKKEKKGLKWKAFLPALK